MTPLQARRIERMTDEALRRLLRRSNDDEVIALADQELVDRKYFREQQDDTPCIEWNGFDKPGDY